MAIVSSPNTFTATQTVNASNGVALIGQVGGQELVRLANNAGSPNAAGMLMLSGTNGTGPGGNAWQLGVDTSATTPYRDFYFAKVNADGSVGDSFYASHNGGTNPATFGFGMSQPANDYRLHVHGDNAQVGLGCLQLIQATSQTGHMLSMIDSGGSTEHVWVDPSNANNWLTVFTGDSGTGNPILRVVDKATLVPTFEVDANGSVTMKNAAATSVQLNIANSAKTSTINATATGELTLGNSSGTLITLGNHNTGWTALGFFGKAAILQPARTGALTDNSGGISGGATIAVINGGSGDATAAKLTDTQNAIATLAAKVNALELLWHNYGLTA